MSAEGADGLLLPLGNAAETIEIAELAAGERIPFDPYRWRGRLVMVQTGELHLQCRSGQRAMFRAGSVLSLERLPLVSVSAGTRDAAILLLLSRQRAD